MKILAHAYARRRRRSDDRGTRGRLQIRSRAALELACCFREASRDLHVNILYTHRYLTKSGPSDPPDHILTTLDRVLWQHLRTT